ncbi:type III secretion system chaperone [Roseiconus lacunae]|uniref:type III secretion system chaperone n=1 Tax=Roseiconus lacunae TaxID=2605694 RepID=UPI001E51789D|nr:type III secretion system chaperone [Roseiconus lacunae]MCD0457910.1 type III secretion system chaperone [Roseiconus lacunae]
MHLSNVQSKLIETFATAISLSHNRLVANITTPLESPATIELATDGSGLLVRLPLPDQPASQTALQSATLLAANLLMPISFGGGFARQSLQSPLQICRFFPCGTRSDLTAVFQQVKAFVDRHTDFDKAVRGLHQGILTSVSENNTDTSGRDLLKGAIADGSSAVEPANLAPQKSLIQPSRFAQADVDELLCQAFKILNLVDHDDTSTCPHHLSSTDGAIQCQVDYDLASESIVTSAIVGYCEAEQALEYAQDWLVKNHMPHAVGRCVFGILPSDWLLDLRVSLVIPVAACSTSPESLANLLSGFLKQAEQWHDLIRLNIDTVHAEMPSDHQRIQFA